MLGLNQIVEGQRPKGSGKLALFQIQIHPSELVLTSRHRSDTKMTKKWPEKSQRKLSMCKLRQWQNKWKSFKSPWMIWKRNGTISTMTHGRSGNNSCGPFERPSERAKSSSCKGRVCGRMACGCHRTSTGRFFQLVCSTGRNHWQLLYVPCNEARRAFSDDDGLLLTTLDENAVRQMVKRYLHHTQGQPVLLQRWSDDKLGDKNEAAGGPLGQTERRTLKSEHEGDGSGGWQRGAPTGHDKVKTLLGPKCSVWSLYGSTSVSKT